MIPTIIHKTIFKSNVLLTIANDYYHLPITAPNVNPKLRTVKPVYNDHPCGPGTSKLWPLLTYGRCVMKVQNGTTK